MKRRAWGALLAIALFATACGADDDSDSGENSDNTANDTNGDTDGDMSEWEPEWVDGVLQPLPDGFPDRPISIIVTDEDGAGSDDGIFARHVQEAASDMSPVRIDVLDRPDLDAGYGVWDGIVNQRDDPNGSEGYSMLVYALAGSVVDLLATPLAEDLDVTLDDANFVMTMEELPWLAVTPTDAPWGNSFSDMVAYAEENPGEVRFITRGPGSASDLGLWSYLVDAGVEIDAVVGGSHEENVLTIAAGEGDVAIPVAGTATPFIQDGRIELLGCVGNTSPCAGFDSGALSLAAATESDTVDPWGANRGLLVPPTVPDEHRQWLAELLRAVTEDDGFRENRSHLPGLTITARDHDETRELGEHVMEISRDVLEQIGGLDTSID